MTLGWSWGWFIVGLLALAAAILLAIRDWTATKRRVDERHPDRLE